MSDDSTLNLIAASTNGRLMLAVVFILILSTAAAMVITHNANFERTAYRSSRIAAAGALFSAVAFGAALFVI